MDVFRNLNCMGKVLSCLCTSKGILKEKHINNINLQSVRFLRNYSFFISENRICKQLYENKIKPRNEVIFFFVFSSFHKPKPWNLLKCKNEKQRCLVMASSRRCRQKQTLKNVAVLKIKKKMRNKKRLILGSFTLMF